MRILVTGGSGFIGTNLIELLREKACQLLNLDITEPYMPAHAAYWQQADILDTTQVRRIVVDFAPEAVIHLAARAECDENTTVEEGYQVNTLGTQNLLEAVKAAPVRRLIVTSTQFVCAPGRFPKNDEDYFPGTVYGQSKVVTEQLTRKAGLQCCWTIVRPTNVWGPWHFRYRREFWRVLERGFYAHPGKEPVIRSYGYVGNVVHQMWRILEMPVDAVNGKTLYVGDRPTNLMNWVNGFSKALRGREVRTVPRPLMRLLALIGDLPTWMTGKPFLINSSRFRSMVTDYPTPMEPTLDLLGENPVSLQAGIDETVSWLKSYTGSGKTGGGF